MYYNIDKMNSRSIILITIFLLLSQTLVAQTKENPWTIGLWGVKTEYIGDLGNNVFKFDKDLHLGGAFSLDRYVSRFFDAGIYGSLSCTGMNNGISTYTDFKQWDKRSEYENEVKNFKIDNMSNVNIHTRFKIWGNDDARFVPYIGLAGGMAFYKNIQTNYLDGKGNQQVIMYGQKLDDSKSDAKMQNALTISAILGLEFRLNKSFSIRYQATGSWTNHDDYDFYAKSGKDWQLQHNIGVTFNFNGKRKDSDRDGVPDYLDRCPKTPFGDAVDKYGCTIPPVIIEFVCNDTQRKPPVVIIESECIDTCQDTVSPIIKDSCQVLFDFNKYEVQEKAKAKLDSIAEILIRHSDFIVTISGHADNIGTNEVNMEMSKHRAEFVEQYLLIKGLDKKCIETKWYGSTRPVADNDTPEGQAKNRRVEILIIIFTYQ